MEHAEQTLDIETLLGGGSVLLGRQNVLNQWLPHVQTEPQWKDFSSLAQPDLESYEKRDGSDAPTDAVNGLQPITVTVRGADIGDLPTQYDVIGLEQHELPVIGTYVDPSVCIGFRYKVRNLSSGKYLFHGRSLPLQSIGMGYGKRLTFKGETLNENHNFFYSDTQLDGYGFSLVAVEAGDVFDICDEDSCVVGRATVSSIQTMHKEISSRRTASTGGVEKHIPVSMSCVITDHSASHGLLSLQTQESLNISGIAVVSKEKRSAPASTLVIKDVMIPAFGMCRLHRYQVPLLS